MSIKKTILDVNAQIKKHSEKIEPWILHNVFQKFSDFTYRFIKTTNFFWAVVSVATTMVSTLYLVYIGLFVEKDPLIITIPFLLIPTYLFPAMYLFKKTWYGAYDSAVYGKESEFKERWADRRAGALVATTVSTMLWLIIRSHNSNISIAGLVVWISLIQYPFYSFCSCTPPRRNHQPE